MAIGPGKIALPEAVAETALSSNFDLRSFHEALLLAGPMPPDIMELQGDRWFKSHR